MSQPSRRTLLRVGAGVAVTGLTGCLGDRSADPVTSRTTNETTEDSAELPEHVRWQAEVDGEVRLGPALLGDTLYVGASSGGLRALDPADGTEHWRFDTGASFFSGTGTDYSPVLADGTLYAVSGDRGGAHGDNFAVYAVDAASGAKQWSVERGYPNFLSLLGVAGNRAFVGTSDDVLGDRDETLLALDSQTGEELWTADIGDPRGAVVTADAAYVGASDWVDAFDATDGTRRWTRKLDGRVLGPEIGDEVVFAGFRAGRESGALALDADSGATRWGVEDRFVTSLIADDSLYVGGEYVAAFASDGTERWRHDDGGLLSDASLTGDSLYVSGNPVTALSADDGTVRWSTPLDAEFGVVEGADERVVAVQRENGTVLDVLDAENGEKRFTFDVGGKSVSQVAVDSGTVYVGNDDGALFALRAD